MPGLAGLGTVIDYGAKKQQTDFVIITTTACTSTVRGFKQDITMRFAKMTGPSLMRKLQPQSARQLSQRRGRARAVNTAYDGGEIWDKKKDATPRHEVVNASRSNALKFSD